MDEQAFQREIIELCERHKDAVESHRLSDTEAFTSQIFALVGKWADEDSSPGWLLAIEADRCEQNADWAGAESAHRAMLALYVGSPAESMAQMELADFYCLVNRKSDALQHARLATAAARREDSLLTLAMSLETEARCLVRMGHLIEANAIITEALSVLNDEPTYNHLRAWALILRAKCAVVAGRMPDADRDLDVAYGILQPLAAMESAGGIHSGLAQWWSVSARLCTAREDYEGSVAAWNNAVKFAKHVAELPQIERVYALAAVAFMLKGLAGALSSVGRGAGGRRVERERRLLLDDLGVPEPD